MKRMDENTILIVFSFLILIWFYCSKDILYECHVRERDERKKEGEKERGREIKKEIKIQSVMGYQGVLS